MLNADERKPGRPPLERGSRSTSVHIRLGPSLHDEASRKAIQAGMTLPKLVRKALQNYDPDDENDD